MGHQSPSSRRRRSQPPSVQKLEARDLPTAPTFYGLLPRPTVHVSQTAAHDLTPRGQAKFAFVGLFKGTFTTGPALFQDQAAQTFIRGAGTASAALHANIQAALYTPREPNAPTTGLLGLFDKTVSNSSSQVFLTLTSDPTSLDRTGRPTRFTWSAENGSGGFGGATGEGTMEIRYSPRRNMLKGATRAGTVSIILKGQIVTDNGVSNLLTISP
ncbi:hypothetical protein SAMN05444166_3932 [Singulisphaera sp. GP187]|uniref:hypothetical protein n=1 Tax=Singulisphaera sp. GP187 TaxID=1882752 RepID=UPI000928A510|nr:hypothetical protein [Singulisphaera sp. GP187]SIO34219.1 hypothetical protein SAMN05444166_3932 [Singulisphaera sp. GP187]